MLSLKAVDGEAALETLLATPSQALIEDMRAWRGTLAVLGAGGKMGPSLAALAANAARAANAPLRVVAVSRFGKPEVRQRLEAVGVCTHAADLLDENQLAALPDADYVVFMVGFKFGSTGREPWLWAVNAYLPGRVAERYRNARMVAFSTGNVYDLRAVAMGGADEQTQPAPIGEYGQSCLARERVLHYFSVRYGMPLAIIRLNYAVELRYGVLLDVAERVWREEPIDLAMGMVNVIWQGDANEWALRALNHAASPPVVLNVTGPETVSVRWLAEAFGRRLGKVPRFVGQEADTALLSNAGRAHALFGYPRVSLPQAIDAVAEWVRQGLPTFGKPTHFEERRGRF
jgi:nucleoside-diphosphate-sugar epimerase